jgi:glycosyltransferase involved in cell wall biosynthesis
MTDPSLRVLVVGHTYIVGVNQAKLNALAAMDRITLGLLVPDSWKAPEWKEPFTLERQTTKVKLYDSCILFSGRAGAYLYAPWTLTRAIRSFRPHIVHIHQEVFSLSALQVAIWAMLFRKDLVIECAEDTDRPLSFLRRLSRTVVLANVRLIITCSHKASETLRNWRFSGPIEFIPHLGVDSSLFSHTFKRPVNSAFTVGFLGRFAHEKGIDLIFTACHRLREKGIAFRIMICGAGPEESTLRQMAVRLGISDIVTWKGKVPHSAVPRMMSAFDVLVLPSRTNPTWREQFGHVLIEAMSMGIPVVGSTCGEIPHVIGRNDVLFPENDATALSEILERMIREPAWTEELKQYSVGRIENNFTHQRIAERLVDVWSKILNSDV